MTDFAETGASSGQLSRKLQGGLRSATFTITRDKIAYRIRGSGATVNLIIDGFQRIRDPIYGGLTFKATKDRFDRGPTEGRVG